MWSLVGILTASQRQARAYQRRRGGSHWAAGVADGLWYENRNRPDAAPGLTGLDASCNLSPDMARQIREFEPLHQRVRVSAQPDLLNIGRFDAESGCYSPSDAEVAAESMGATCGPASFGAACRTPVTAALGHFPYFPSRNWTTVGDMRNALRSAQTRFADTDDGLPAYGLALLQLKISPGWLHPLYSLRQTHWVAVFGECFYDLNWRGWLPVLLWEDLVLSRLSFGGEPVRCWEVRNGIEILEDDLLAAAIGHSQTAAAQPRSAACHAGAVDRRCPA